jgi:mannose-6-phosphate isomerase
MAQIVPISFLSVEQHPKAWGNEGWVVNNDKYCAKILDFNAGRSFSDHFHWTKEETWYVLKGHLILEYYDLSNATRLTKKLHVGDVVHVPPGNPHKLTAVVDSTILEVSTRHEETDSYRIGKGDSQKAAPTV